MGARVPLAATVALAAGGLLLASCASQDLEDSQKVAGELSASVLRPEAEQAFARKGHPIQGRLECETDTSDRKELRVRCSGSTHDDKVALFEGSIDEERIAVRKAGEDGLPGYYVGSVDGTRIFRMNCFNCAPESPDTDPQPGALPPGHGLAPRVGPN